MSVNKKNDKSEQKIESASAFGVSEREREREKA